MKIILPVALILMISASASAQWTDYKWKGVPRTADGKPNLKAPAPKGADGKPDLSGLWHNLDAKYLNDLSSDGMEKSEGKILVYIDDGTRVEARKLFSFAASGASLSFKNPQRITQGPAATKPGQKTLVVATEDNAASAQIIVV